MKKLNLLLGSIAVLAALTGCGTTAMNKNADGGQWDGGTWNSVLGYHGPTNVLVSGPK